jgi:hypothetical protein
MMNRQQGGNSHNFDYPYEEQFSPHSVPLSHVPNTRLSQVQVV